MSGYTRYAVRSMWWRRFHPLVRVGWYLATAGSSRPATQTAVGVGLVGAGLLLRSSHKARLTPVYTQVISPGQTTKIRVYRGTSAPSETVIGT